MYYQGKKDSEEDIDLEEIFIDAIVEDIDFSILDER
jgi:hypothetical protein